MRNKTSFLILASLFVASALFAKIETPRVFSDNMVLQRNKPVKVWGTSDANAEVCAEFGGKKTKVRAGGDGKWSMEMPKFPASKKPAELKLYENGKLSKTIKNVLVGEVWLASGQSNMEMTIGALKVKEPAPLNKLVRYFRQPSGSISASPKYDNHKDSAWYSADPSVDNSSADMQTGSWGGSDVKNPVRNFSAVAYFFANKLANDLDVPVGILYAARGATAMLTWIPESGADKDEWVKKQFADFKVALKSYDDAAYKKRLAEHKKKVADFDAAVAKAKAEKKRPPSMPVWSFRIPPSRITPWGFFDSPMCDYNGKIAPMAGYSMRGFLWYQGESNTGKNRGEFYPQLQTLIESWRDVWKSPKMPFLQVQLTSYRESAGWPEARECQRLSSVKMDNVYVANTIDLGEEKDIHPSDKREVGERLEKIAMRRVYGDASVSDSFPTFKDVEYVNGGALVKFKSASSLEGKGQPRGFELKIDGKWVSARPELRKGAVFVVAQNNKKPEGVRYLWKTWTRPDAWLFNSDGLPAFAFKAEK